MGVQIDRLERLFLQNSYQLLQQVTLAYVDFK